MEESKYGLIDGDNNAFQCSDWLYIWITSYKREDVILLRASSEILSKWRYNFVFYISAKYMIVNDSEPFTGNSLDAKCQWVTDISMHGGIC